MGASRMNISLPDELAEQVRAYGLSVSAVCQEALRKAVEHEEAKERFMADMKAVTERLRDTVNAEKRVEGERGHEAGTRWARQAATYSELVYLAYDFIEDAETFDSEHSLVDFMSREDGEHYEFVVVVAGDPYWKGFIAGAEKIWEAVASDLEPLYGRS